MSDTNQLHLAPLFDPLWHELEGEYLVYDRASGATHRFDLITAILLKRLQVGPALVPALVDHVAETLGFEVGDELIDHINEVLHELQRSDFVSFNQQ